MERQIISTQDDWRAIRCKFENKSAYRKFRANYQFNSESRIFRTGRAIEKALDKLEGERYEIFRTLMTDNNTVLGVYDSAKKIGNGNAEPDADVFVALYTDFIRLQD